APGKTLTGSWVGVRQLSPSIGHPGVEPIDVLVRSGLIGCDRLSLPVTLPLHSEVRHPETEGLLVRNEGAYLLGTQKLESGHDRFRPREPWVRKVGKMPVVRTLPSLLGKVGPRPLRAEKVGLVSHIIASLGNALGPMIPVD